MKLADLFFDRRCAICDCHIRSGAVCAECDSELKSHIRLSKRTLYLQDKPLEVMYVFDYDVPIVKELLFTLKRRANKDLFLYAARLYEKAVPKDFEGIVVNCPRSGKGVRSYGYDQVEQPCRMMCKNSGGRLKFAKLVARKGSSKEQKNLTQEQRYQNTQNRFKIIKKDIPKNILIVDDVVTTGSTVSACAVEILKHGANSSISVCCLASRDVFTRKG